MTACIDPLTVDDDDDAPPPIPASVPAEAAPAASARVVAVATPTPTVLTAPASLTKGAPEFSLMTPRAWELLEDAASEMSATSTGFERRVRNSIASTVLLTSLAEALDMDAAYARAYIRVLHDSLARIGVHLRERRLKRDGDLASQHWNVTGDFIQPADRADAKRAAKAAEREHSRAVKAVKDGDASAAAIKAKNDLALALADAEAVVHGHADAGSKLPIVRHAYAVVIDPDLYLSA